WKEVGVTGERYMWRRPAEALPEWSPSALLARSCGSVARAITACWHGALVRRRSFRINRGSPEQHLVPAVWPRSQCQVPSATRAGRRSVGHDQEQAWPLATGDHPRCQQLAYGWTIATTPPSYHGSCDSTLHGSRG